MVLGSIGYGGIERIRQTYALLRREGFDVLDHIEQDEMDYSDVKDFRTKRILSKRIVEHDLRFLEKADVVVALSNGPSYGTAIEMFVAKKNRKKVLLLAKKPVPTPWPVNFSDQVVANERELVRVLHEINKR